MPHPLASTKPSDGIHLASHEACLTQVSSSGAQRDILDSEEYYNADKAIQSFLLKILPSVPSAWSFASCYLALSGLSLGMLDWSNCTAVERSPERVSGAWLFKGTRVPVKALFENLEEGARLDDFLDWFPGVTREQVLAVLNHAEKSLVTA